MITSDLCLVVVFATSVFGYVEVQKPSIQLNINSVASKCINASEMTEDQLHTAIQERDLDKISACFFKCYLNHFGVVTRENERDIVNIPMTLVFVKMYIPDISFFDLLAVGVEVANCSKDFEKNTPSDDHPHCFKTKALINCLAKKKTLHCLFRFGGSELQRLCFSCKVTVRLKDCASAREGRHFQHNNALAKKCFMARPRKMELIILNGAPFEVPAHQK